ncbi:hypothetical protein GQ44DRAFT_570322, partial [Phaeosphaeriaceae sp. PMI808]
HPPLWFHVFRFFQLLASSVVAGLMLFFIHHLRGEEIKIPWFFFFLQSAALSTLAWLACSTLLRCCHRLSSFISAIVNGFLGSIWIVAFSLLAWRMGALTIRGCTPELWGNDKGVYVCQLYKVLFSAAALGVLSNICVFVVDMRMLHSRDKRGQY